LRQERLYFFQFPTPFPTFVSPTSTHSEPSETINAPKSEAKRVSFSADTKPPAPVPVPEDVDKEKPPAHVDGIIGNLEIYQSGSVKMRLANDILLDVSHAFGTQRRRFLFFSFSLTRPAQVTAATQPSFLQQAVHVDRSTKDLRVLGEISRRFVVTPDIDSLLVAVAQADETAAAATKPEIDGLLSMDTT
jgi:DNA-directed RNA polymerase III subunit RPC4